MSLTGGLTTNQSPGINNTKTQFEFMFLRNDYALACARDHGIKYHSMKFCQAL